MSKTTLNYILELNKITIIKTAEESVKNDKSLSEYEKKHRLKCYNKIIDLIDGLNVEDSDIIKTIELMIEVSDYGKLHTLFLIKNIPKYIRTKILNIFFNYKRVNELKAIYVFSSEDLDLDFKEKIESFLIIEKLSN